ncbi:hypothetical protein H5410_041515 [Solanum commersonii]|uniref:Uncharacterized protein n=1 Tax=Solanum commersonii TaxID=4109 RepID=A0A9J5XS32_SOLCO|nr:hypothetical protein H5410_041515 [Solanum commersonii]
MTLPDKYKPNIPYTMELILQIEKGDRIHASIDKFTIKVVGHVVSYEPIQLLKQGDNNSSFMNIVVEDEQRNKLPATLWGDLAFQMQSHLSGSTDEPLIVVLQLMKTHKFRGEYEKVSQTSSQQHISISEKLSTGMTPIKNIISDCVSSQNEDVIDLTGKLYPNSGKHVGV